MSDLARWQGLLAHTRAHLLSLRNATGYWEGHLSSSALATATALTALSLADAPADAGLRVGAADWLAMDQNADGGWGDTPDSPSNLSTTLLSLSALTLAGVAPQTRERAGAYLDTHGGRAPEAIVAALRRAYGADRTFAVPILMNCALAGLVPWSQVPSLPCELAAVPAGLYRLLRLQVVSYALPALIAVGLVIDHHQPSGLSPLRRGLRPLLLRKLAHLQPAHGGFLEATPLTAFTAMSLLAAYGPEQTVARQCLDFLRQSGRADGSWPIDTNLATWVTTSAANALLVGQEEESFPGLAEIIAWVAGQQYREVHPYTGAAPGGFAWTNLPGAVPDADDTSGALLLLRAAGQAGANVPPEALAHARRWLLGLQNADGGWPTFCRGWGQLPFDQSCPDITAHALRALGKVPARRRGLAYLRRTQRPDGSWLPLWFGNQQAPEQANPVLGTARVVLALAEEVETEELCNRGIRHLLQAQQPDGGFGGDRAAPPSVEETALALSALCARWDRTAGTPAAARRAAEWLARRITSGAWVQPAPIGLYFARLWYAESLYPVLWTVEALGRLVLVLQREHDGDPA